MTREGALKAWETRRKNGWTSEKIEDTTYKNFDTPNKNIFRCKLISILNENRHYKHGNNILALESPQLLFVKNLPKFKFDIYEKDEQVYEGISIKKPSNVDVFNTDIAFAASSRTKYYAAFLDFCNKFESNVITIKKLVPLLWDSKYVAFTFCLRGHKSENSRRNAVSDITMKVCNLLPSHIPIEAYSYSDGSPMYVSIYEKNKEVKHRRYRKNGKEIA